MDKFQFSEASFRMSGSPSLAATYMLASAFAVRLLRVAIGHMPILYAHTPANIWKDASGGTVYQALGELSKINREAYSFYAGILANLNTTPYDQAVSLENRQTFQVAGHPAKICEEILSSHCRNCRMISLGSAEPFDRDCINFQLLEFDDSLEIKVETLSIYNISTLAHAEQHARSISDLSYRSLTTENFRGRKSIVFRHLRFTDLVCAQISGFNSGEVGAIFGRLKELDSTAQAWIANDLSYPNWQCVVTGESDSTMDNGKERAKRMFPDSKGNTSLFELHAKVGGNRIHLRVLHDEKILEIGYVGRHL